MRNSSVAQGNPKCISEEIAHYASLFSLHSDKPVSKEILHLFRRYISTYLFNSYVNGAFKWYVYLIKFVTLPSETNWSLHSSSQVRHLPTSHRDFPFLLKQHAFYSLGIIHVRKNVIAMLSDVHTWLESKFEL